MKINLINYHKYNLFILKIYIYLNKINYSLFEFIKFKHFLFNRV